MALYTNVGQSTLVSQHLSLLGYKEGDTVHYRAFLPHIPGKKNIDKGRKTDAPFGRIPEELAQWESEGRGIYMVVNKGGAGIEEITDCTALFYEHDDLDKETSAALWEGLGLPEPTFQLDTGGKSVHSYWVLDHPVGSTIWRSLQTDLLDYADADRSLKNQNRVMRLPGFIHPVSGEVSKLIECSGKRYSYKILRQLIPGPEVKDPPAKQQQLPSAPAAASYDDDRTLAREMLSYIPTRQPGSGTYEDSFKVLAALVHKFGQVEGLALARQWSPDEDWGEDLERKVNSLRGGARPVTFGTLVAMARANGYQSPIKTESAPPRQGPQTLTELDAKGRVGEVEAKYQEFRKEIAIALQIPDLIEREFCLDEIGIKHRKGRDYMKRVTSELEQRQKPTSETEFDLQDLLNEKVEGTRYLIEDWIPEGESILLTAKPKVGKSLLAYEAAYGVATGEGFLGKRAKQGRVLIIQTEEGKSELKKRLYTRGFDKLPKGQVQIWTQFKVHKDIPKLEATLAEFRPSLVIIDSLRRVTAGSGVSENEAAFANFVYELSDVTRAYDSALIVIHHDKKDKEAQGIDAISGSLALAGAAWGSWRLIKTSTNENSPDRMLSCTVRGSAGSRHKIRMTEGEGCSWGWQWEQEIGADPEVHEWENRILAILACNKHCEMSMSELVQVLGLEKGARHLYRPMNRLIERGRVQMRRDESNRRLWWYKTIGTADHSPPPTPAETGAQNSLNPNSPSGCTPSAHYLHSAENAGADSPPVQINRLDQVDYLSGESDQKSAQTGGCAEGVQIVCNLDEQRVSGTSTTTINRQAGGESDPSPQPGYEVNGVWHYRQDAKPRRMPRTKTVHDLVKEQSISALNQGLSITADRPDWHDFERGLISASTFSELVAAKQSAPESLRVDCMARWSTDGRYETLAAKAEQLKGKE